jgi:uncharacterized cupin superfamily protein
MNEKELLEKCDVVLNMDDPNFVEKFSEAIGAKPGEPIEFITPQFNRVDGIDVSSAPKTLEEYASLAKKSKEELKAMGCGIWDVENGKTHWLYPHEWYNQIPNGLEITDISGKIEKFERGITNDNKRFGMLPYGFIQENK